MDRTDGAGEPDAFLRELTALGFRPQGQSRRGGRMWSLGFNRYLTFVLHEYDDAIVLTWSVAFGELLAERGWRTSISDASVLELYPTSDVRLERDIEAVGREITRVLGTLRLDLGALPA